MTEHWTQEDMKLFLSGGDVPKPSKHSSTVVADNPKRAGRYGIKKTAGKMTKTESVFAELLRLQKDAGDILAWGYEDTSLRIVDSSDHQKSANYRPDFRIVHADHSTEYVEVKRPATVNEASTLRLKMAASKFWPARFTMAIFDKGAWTHKEFG